jgi:predicted TIM-barrel fold metal-dependent hydrolase
MQRRDLLKQGLLAGGILSLPHVHAQEQNPNRRRPLVIDCHVHAGKGMNYGQPEGTVAPYTTFNDPEWTLRKMEEVGIDRSIIFPISNKTYEKANEEIASFVRKYPGKFIGFAKHDQKNEAGKIRELLTREVRELGLKGLKLHGAPTREMLEVVADLEIPILCHPAKVADLAGPVADWPQINFILAHLGSSASRDWREHLAGIALTQRFPNLYIETSGVLFFNYLEQAAATLPATKLLFGSDGPLVDCRSELYKIKLLKLSPEKEALVLSGNILRILPKGTV